jgi:threonine dehydratase
MSLYEEIKRTDRCIRQYVRETFLEYSPYFSWSSKSNVYFKLENLQHTGSFKFRGALNKLLSLNEQERRSGVVAASTGNHGLAIACAANKFDVPCIIFVPEASDATKIKAIKQYRVDVRYYGNDCLETEVHGRRYAVSNGMTYVSPYNDQKIIAGQGTIAVEILRQKRDIDVVFVALGGGGLISGIAGYLKTINLGIKIIGCSPENSAVMIQSIKAGKIIDLLSLPTLSDATAGGVETGSITFDICRRLVDEYITVSEEEIKDNLRLFIENHHMLIEGAAAVAIAAFMKIRKRFRAKNIVIIICGANINPGLLKNIL